MPQETITYAPHTVVRAFFGTATGLGHWEPIGACVFRSTCMHVMHAYRYIQALTHWKGRWQDLLRGHKSADRRGRELRACQPRYSTHKVVDGGALQYEVTLHLPASSPFRVVRGQRCASPAAAKDSAIMSGVVYLWQSGVFGENLRPTPPKDLLVRRTRAVCAVLWQISGVKVPELFTL